MKQPTSGFTHNIDAEMMTGETAPIESGFANLKELYVSPTGPTRLFTATRYGKRYVLKCLKKDFLFTPVYRHALTKEFEIGLQMEHPHICRTENMEEVEGLGPTIVMEYIDGQSLQTLLDKGQPTKMEAERLVGQLAEAVGYIHSKQIVHRDLKPSNVMVTHNGHNVKLIDFGLADSDRSDILKLPAGTSGYIAPEQLLPGAKTDVRADIFSFGMVAGDLAKATGSRRLKAVAALCTRRDAARRPASMAEALAPAPSSVWQKAAAAFLAVVCILLAAYIVATLHHRISPSESQHLQPASNQIVERW